MKEALRQAMSQLIPIADDEWAAFEPHIICKRLKKGDFLLQEGDANRHMGFLISGACRQFYLVNGLEKTTYFFFENDFVGDYDSFLTQLPCDHYVEALENAEVLLFDRDTVQRLYHIYPKFETFARIIAESVYLCAKARLMNFLLDTPEGRYKHFMRSEEAARILQRVPQHYVASYLGITPVSLSRIRSRLFKQSAYQLRV